MPKKVDHQKRRTAIAEAAIVAIAERGLENVRMVDIARAAGATTGTVVHYFPDKDAVLLAALDAVIQHLLSQIAQSLETADPVVEVSSALPINAPMRRDWSIWLQFWARAVRKPEFGKLHEDYYRTLASGLAVSLKAKGFTGDALGLADAIIAIVDGVSVRATLEPEAWPATRQIDLLGRLLTPLLAVQTHDQNA